MVSTWMGDHSSVEVDAVVKNTVKSQEWRNGASNKKLLRQKKEEEFIQFLAALAVLSKNDFEL